MRIFQQQGNEHISAKWSTIKKIKALTWTFKIALLHLHHSLVHYEAEKTISSSVYINLYQFLFFTKGIFFHNFLYKSWMVAFFYIYFYFFHDFKTTEILDWLKISHQLCKLMRLILKCQNIEFFNKNITVLMRHLGLKATWLKSYFII